MAKKLEVYKCEICGNMVEVLHAGQGTLVCCGQDMTLQVENTVDAAQEKHVPVVEKIDGGYKVSVGSVAHPMTQDHWIEWIELVSCEGKYIQRAMLDPDCTPEAIFKCDADKVTAMAYCNLHGLWKS